MRALVGWLPVLVLGVLMIGIQLVGPDILRYDSRLISNSQLWRLLTGHWVHANWMHFVMNMLGFVLCYALTSVSWSLWQWVWRIVLLSSAISMCFLLWNPDISWYVGFSGVLFGLYVLAAVASIAQQAFMSVILLVFIGVKIILEQSASVNMTSSELIGVPVLVDAHLYGVLTALLVLTVQTIVKKFKQINATG